jgi:hypothetical protein
LADKNKPTRWVAPLTDAEVALLDRHKGGFRTTDQVSDRQRKAGLEIAREGVRSARDAWIEQMSGAWETDKRRKRDEDEDPDDPDDPDPDEDALDREFGADRARAIRARQKMIDRATSAWRAPATPTALPSPNPLNRRPGLNARPPTGDAAPPDREAMYEQRKRDLESAWKNVGASPSCIGPSPDWVGARR